MSEQEKKPSIFEGAKYLCAERLKGKACNVTIKRVDKADIIGDAGRKTPGFEVHFAEVDTPHAFTCMSNRKSLASIFGTDDYTQYAGKRVTIYPAITKVKGVEVQAIRYRAVEQTTKGE